MKGVNRIFNLYCRRGNLPALAAETAFPALVACAIGPANLIQKGHHEAGAAEEQSSKQSGSKGFGRPLAESTLPASDMVQALGSLIHLASITSSIAEVGFLS